MKYSLIPIINVKKKKANARMPTVRTIAHNVYHQWNKLSRENLSA